MNNRWYVRIIEEETEEVVKTMGPMPERKAHKVADGVEINLNHDRFYVQVVEKLSA